MASTAAGTRVKVVIAKIFVLVASSINVSSNTLSLGHFIAGLIA